MRLIHIPFFILRADNVQKFTIKLEVPQEHYWFSKATDKLPGNRIPLEILGSLLLITFSIVRHITFLLWRWFSFWHTYNKLTREIPEKKLKYIVRKLYISNQHEETNEGNEINGTRRVMPIFHVHCTMDLSWKKCVYLRQTKGRLDITRSSRFILEQ